MSITDVKDTDTLSHMNAYGYKHGEVKTALMSQSTQFKERFPGIISNTLNN